MKNIKEIRRQANQSDEGTMPSRRGGAPAARESFGRNNDLKNPTKDGSKSLSKPQWSLTQQESKKNKEIIQGDAPGWLCTAQKSECSCGIQSLRCSWPRNWYSVQNRQRTRKFALSLLVKYPVVTLQDDWAVDFAGIELKTHNWSVSNHSNHKSNRRTHVQPFPVQKLSIQRLVKPLPQRPRIILLQQSWGR